MKTYLSNLISGRRVLVLGYGREGQSTLRLLRQLGTATALDVADGNADLANTDGLTGHFGAQYLHAINGYDLVFKSPGISLNTQDYTATFTSQVEVFLACYGGQTIGITGTKGKSTVSTLTHHILTHAGLDAILGGNIGVPVFDLCDQMHPDTVMVMELSCHQLQYCHHAPHLAVFLNLYQDHLDYYGTMERYGAAKAQIYRNQKPGDLLIASTQLALDPPGTLLAIDPDHIDPQILSAMDKSSLQGAHNGYNCAVAFALCQQFGVDFATFAHGLQSYHPLAHRLQPVGTVGGVAYYDDSISTTAQSAIAALESLPQGATILLGGMDRGIDYEPLVAYLLANPPGNVVLMYPSGHRIGTMLDGQLPHVHLCEDLKEAVAVAKRVTPSGGHCVLSPAAASYGFFLNFAARGDAFQALIKE